MYVVETAVYVTTATKVEVAGLVTAAAAEVVVVVVVVKQ